MNELDHSKIMTAEDAAISFTQTRAMDYLNYLRDSVRDGIIHPSTYNELLNYLNEEFPRVGFVRNETSEYCFSIGEIMELDGAPALIVRVGDNEVTIAWLNNPNWCSVPFTVKDVYNISQDEMRDICGMYEYSEKVID